MKNIIDFSSLTVKLASPDEVKAWSHGEVTKPETINYRTLKPEKDGLFCERIFGPSKDWECYCGKYKRIRYRGIICDKCGVEVTQSRVRRERMGHIKLACPVAHVWFFKGAPSKISLLLDVSPRNLTGVIYFARYLVLEVKDAKKKEALKKLEIDLKRVKEELKEKNKKEIARVKKESKKKLKEIDKNIKSKEQKELAKKEAEIKKNQKIISLKEDLNDQQETAEDVYKAVADLVKKIDTNTILTEEEYLKLADYGVSDFLKVGMGAESLLEAIKKLDLDRLVTKLRQKARKIKTQKRVKIIKRLRVAEGMKNAGINPVWMILRFLPVIPPDLRPMVQLSGGRFATSDLNDLYRRVINRNNRLKHLIGLGAPEIILRNEKRMLQESVDTLIDSSQSGQSRRRGRGSRELKSLSEMLRGKQGRFRRNLLGKRVDYSGRSVIVVGPELKLNQCGLPKEMALELFKPYVLRELIAKGFAPNVRSAKYVLEKKPPEVFDILGEITKKHPVFLNRAPTLHKLGIQAFFPVLIEGNAISLHPCVCAGYNADFDGDQMAVHVPLSEKAKKEAEKLMMPEKNLLKPADGSPITLPNKEIALGYYYLTFINHDLVQKENQHFFASPNEAIFALQQEAVKVHEPIRLKTGDEIIETTAGRVLFNKALPKSLRFINQSMTAGRVKDLIRKALKVCTQKEMVKLIDDLKELGFAWATKSAISVAVSDCKVIPEKEEIIKKANKKVEEIEKNFKLGLITNEEKKRLSNDVWLGVTEEIADKTWEGFGSKNTIRTIIASGSTRASKDQIKQLAAMRGLVVDPLGKIVELPTKSNFREGLSVFEYVTSARGSRKGLTDSAIKTADAGYLTRRLVDVSHDMIIRMEDCGTKKGLEIKRQGRRSRMFFSRVLGRVLAKKVSHPKTKKTLFKKGEIITEEKLSSLNKTKVEKVTVRSPLKCEAPYGLCQKCYGWDFSTKEIVEIGVPVGVMAAQSIGEPGTQLTMRVKHFGGIVVSDVTQGLPRVEELFEARRPKVLSPISEISGRVRVKKTSQGYKIKVKNTNVKPAEEKTYTVSLTSTLKVKSGDLIPAGHQLASGGLNIQDVLEVRGLSSAQAYLVSEVQRVYESQGIPINDKHFEVIVKKMSSKVKIESPGDTPFLIGEVVEKTTFTRENAAVLAAGGEPATAQVIILGISRSALFTESWLSAASFEETSNVLTNAAISGKIDYLMGLKENVIIGRLIPTSKKRAVIDDSQ